MLGRRLWAVLLLTAALVLAACGNGDNGNGAAGDGDANGDTGAGTTEAATVAVQTNDQLGEYLVDSEGMTLYLFTQDQGTTTACTGGCADNWPPLVADGEPVAGDGVDAGALTTSADGIEPNQVVYNGHLLYYFAGDQAPGDTNGIGIPSWFAVNPAGDAIEAE